MPKQTLVSGTHRFEPASRMLSIDDLEERNLGSSRHIRRLVDAGKFPPPVQLGRLRRWPEHVITEWIARGCPSVGTNLAGGTQP